MTRTIAALILAWVIISCTWPPAQTTATIESLEELSE